jgi:hypothetical protein
MANPFAAHGVPDGNHEIQGLVDQAVILQSALVPKLPEIGITDGMIPIIDQVYPDSGSNSEFTPGTTINFNFGNAHGKLVDWTQSRLNFTVQCETSFTYKTGASAGTESLGIESLTAATVSSDVAAGTAS